ATESKSARKRKAKAEAAAAVATPAGQAPQSPNENSQNGNEDSDNAYVKELQKSLRNVNKKLSGMHKVTAILSENPDKSLDELVESRVINKDQKEQALKKPTLESQREQLESQLAQHKKLSEEFQQKWAREKELMEAGHSEELKKLEETIRGEEELKAQKAQKARLLTFSRFLRAAAARRQLEDDESDMSKAFEGALLLVYGGDLTAVDAAEKLIDGTEEKVCSTEGQELNITYAQVKQAALEDAPFAAEEAWVNEVAEANPAPPTEEATPVSDPTVANAGLTEIDTTVAATNGTSETEEASAAPAATSVDDGAANAAGAGQWDTKAIGEDSMAESFEMVPRDPAETESAHVPAGHASTQSWAEETQQTEPAAARVNGGDGFQEVASSRGGRGRGGFTTEYPRAASRGRGHGHGRGRGRGSFRGDRARGGFRG
ncbi:hypothetical protein K490DRAFT_10788, partial [Saccharata proteae CBS 121410]